MNRMGVLQDVCVSCLHEIVIEDTSPSEATIFMSICGEGLNITHR